ncbi:hypothetical protein FHR75_000568 [Kineococcus radiotolerans]|uniref:EcsC family protein n=1 Tax=Kineococcus radiotolerans TaxID=131568 RepID=A0A7W4TJ08_KINRA|nr:EcsC family protein [Kineococcus radiotolerans]MBB2899780.1 hypothetical protein [Kineococcus radiotolerans]
MTNDVQETAAPAPGGVEGRAADLVQRLLAVGIDGRGPFDSAAEVARAARRRHPDTEAAVSAVVRQHTRLVAGNGFVTGLGGLLTMPVALPANVFGFHVLAVRAVAAIAELRGYDTSRPEVRSTVLLTLVGADATDVLKSVGLPTGNRLTRLATSRVPRPALMLLNKGVGFRLLTRFGTTTLVRVPTRALPVVGGAVGGAVDAVMFRRIAAAAQDALPPTARG